jgi:hypothetical protein
LASKHSLHAVTDFVRGDGKVSGALGSIALKITKALSTICNLHAIHRHPKERTPVSVAEDLDEMVKAGLIDLWDGEADSDGTGLTGFGGHDLMIQDMQFTCNPW